jgi:O-antigen ligase
MISWRFQRLIEKLLSVKFVIFIVATVLLCFGVLGAGEWLTVALTVIAGREIQKFKDFKFTRTVTSEESLGSD